MRLDAGFPDGQTLTSLESASIDYVARIRNNAVLDRMAEPALVLVEWPGELFLDYFWLITNLQRDHYSGA